MFSSSSQNALVVRQTLIYYVKKPPSKREYDEASLIENTKNKKAVRKSCNFKLLFKRKY
jgi:hypothetical protein